MSQSSALRVADLFAGAGGMSTGLVSACDEIGVDVDLVAVNHWPTAVQTHTVNHPRARHYCAHVESVDPRVAVPGGRLHLLMAAPECVHFSTARGGRPMNDQSRASAWHLLRWLELLRVDDVLIENVPEFLTWGPLGANGRPLKSRRGETFGAFVKAVESLNYRVEWRILNAADYGEATTRRRLFIRARRGKKAIDWPEPSHGKRAGGSLLRHVRPWRAAREVIDWTQQGDSIFSRKRPLAPATMRRIVEGLRRFGGPELEPFILHLTHGARPRSVDAPLPTITGANRGELGVAEPFLVPFYTERPEERHARTRSLDEPLPTTTATGGGKMGLIEPFLVPYYGQKDGAPRVSDIDEPVPTIPTENRFGLVEPFVVELSGTGDDNLPRSARIATDGAISLIEPFLSQYYGTSGPTPVSNPVPTVTTRDRFALVEPIVIDGKTLDIRFRMLKPHELSAAMGFPADYQFTGTKTDHVKQIGNAVSVRTARALCLAALDAHGARPIVQERTA